MVKSFTFSRTPIIIFGKGKIAELASRILPYGNDILLVTGANSFISSKHGEYLLNTFDISGINYHLISVNREPSPEIIDKAVVRFRNSNVRLVVAVGGGSAIDTGKAISAMLSRTEPVREFIETVGNKEHPGTKLPFIAVPTTSGTGSEATNNSVISEVGPLGFKRSLRHDNFIPDIAIVDPELTLHCPPNITAVSGMDCFTQLVEAYLSDKATPFTDVLAFDGIRKVIHGLPRVWKWGGDIEARSDMSYAALVSGICIANAGLGVVHGYASSVGALYNIPHGFVCGALMAPANMVTVKKLRKQNSSPITLVKYAEMGKLFSEEQKSQDYYIDLFLSKLSEWAEMMGINHIEKYGITRADFDKIVAQTGNKNNPVKLDKEELSEILELSL
jgi:alcohol dehydrogenase class IV